jgi:hypothetical protein
MGSPLAISARLVVKKSASEKALLECAVALLLNKEPEQ